MYHIGFVNTNLRRSNCDAEANTGYQNSSIAERIVKIVYKQAWYPRLLKVMLPIQRYKLPPDPLELG
jgi:hypothetical protein